MENNQTKIDQFTRDAFSVLLIVFLFGCIIMFFVSLFSEKLVPGGVSAAFIVGVFWVQIKWDIIKRTRIKDASVTELTDLIKATGNKSNE